MADILLDNIFKDIVETIREPLLALDSELKVVLASHSFYGIFKVKPEDTVGQLIYDLGNKQWDIPKLWELLENILPEKTTFNNYEVEHDFTTIGKRTMLLNARQIERGMGKERIILLAIEDITERKEIEAGLEKTRKELVIIKKSADEAHEFADSLIDTVREPLISLDQDLRVVTVSRSFYEFFKVKPEDTVGQLIYDLGNKQWDIPKLRELLENILPEKTTFNNYEVEHDFTTIGKRTMLLNARQIERGMGKERIILLAIEDITKRKQDELEKTRLQNQLNHGRKMEAIGTLAGGIAHDFNNILFPLMGFTEMLQEDLPKDSPLQENVKEVLQAALRAKELVKQILVFSRQKSQELKPVRLQSIIKEALKLLGSSIPKTIDIQTDTDSDCDMVIADSTQIHQIIMNLATNADHAMQESGGELKVSLKQIKIESEIVGFSKLTPGTYALLKVIDTGVGIEKNVMTKIFDPYFTTKEVGKGSGLGLSVVLEIVKSFNGDIHVYSEAGQGTEISVYLPIMKKATEEIEFSAPLPIQGGSERILIVDDDKSIVKMEKRMLERLGYHVSDQTSSIDALKAFEAQPGFYDLVITDMTMPNMTGEQLAKKLIVIKPEIPIIMCTGFSETINKEKSEFLGIKGFLMKPMVKSEMGHAVRKVLDDAKGKLKI